MSSPYPDEALDYPVMHLVARNKRKSEMASITGSEIWWR
jgi:hypothetical protein